MQSTNSKYGTPYFAIRHFHFTREKTAVGIPCIYSKCVSEGLFHIQNS